MYDYLAKTFSPQHMRWRYWRWQKRRVLPAIARLEDSNDRKFLPPDPGIAATVEASLRWLCRAQDQSATADGGVARHFSLASGWSPSYPETTGYIIPTILACGDELGDAELTQRARRMLDWCVEIQMPDGAYQAGMVSVHAAVPTTFNTGQILIGLADGARRFGDPYLPAMHRAATWLRDSQDEDGCWRRFPTPLNLQSEKAYETHVSWGLFEAARVAPDAGYGEAGLKQVRWALTKQRENGWFADCCLTVPEYPLTHTIGYALRGVLEAYRFSGEAEFLTAALRTGRATVGALTRDGRLFGRYDSQWQPTRDYVCLTGQAQLSHCWLMLYELTGDRSFLEGAQRANAFVRRTVKIEGNPDVVGGVKGSFPAGGGYGSYEYLNWAAKFFIDTNRYEERIAKGITDLKQS